MEREKRKRKGRVGRRENGKRKRREENGRGEIKKSNGGSPQFMFLATALSDKNMYSVALMHIFMLQYASNILRWQPAKSL